MIRDLGGFTRKDFMVDCVCPAEKWGWNKAQKVQRVQDLRGGSRKQRPLIERPLIQD